MLVRTAKTWTHIAEERVTELLDAEELTTVNVANATFPAFDNPATIDTLSTLARVDEPLSNPIYGIRAGLSIPVRYTVEFPTLVLIGRDLYHVDDPRVVKVGGEYKLAERYMNPMFKQHGKAWRYLR